MTDISAPTLRLLTASFIKGVGPATIKKIAQLPDFWNNKPEQIGAEVSAFGKALSKAGTAAWDDARRWAETQVETAEQMKAQIISVCDSGYPILLKSTPADPGVLFVKGTLRPQSPDSVAIIGTREPTDHGVIIADRLAGFFAESDWSIVSGLAMGCDVAAHLSVIKAKRHTVAVLAHGLQTIAPPRHREIAEQIVECGGALVTEYPYGTEPSPPNFVKRDLIQAGLSSGVVMIQSDREGGSLHAARAALSYGRWLAVPAPTKADRMANSPKIQANLILTEASAEQKLELLHTKDQSSLQRLIVLNTKDDYPNLLAQRKITQSMADSTDQSGLFAS